VKPAWVLKNPLEAAQKIKEREDVRKKIKLIDDLVSSHMQVRQLLVDRYQKNGGINIIEPMIVEDLETEIIVDNEKKEVSTDEAVLNILEATTSPGILSARKIETQETAQTRRDRANWADIFGPDVLREEMSKDRNFTQHYRNAISTLLFSKRLDDDSIANFRQNSVDFTNPDDPIVNFSEAVNFIDTVVNVNQIRTAYRKPDPVARIIALVYKQRSGLFISHENFIDLANQIMLGESHEGSLLIGEIIDVMLLETDKESSEDFLDDQEEVEIPQQVDLIAKNENDAEIIEVARQTSKDISAEKEIKLRTLAKGIVLNAIDSLNAQAKAEGMMYKFPVAPTVTFSKPQADKLCGGLANPRHRSYDRKTVDNSFGLSTSDMIVALLWKTNRRLATNKSLMKKITPLIRDVYKEIYEAEENP
jgi:hypothetical protein